MCPELVPQLRGERAKRSFPYKTRREPGFLPQAHVCASIASPGRPAVPLPPTPTQAPGRAAASFSLLTPSQTTQNAVLLLVRIFCAQRQYLLGDENQEQHRRKGISR